MAAGPHAFRKAGYGRRLAVVELLLEQERATSDSNRRSPAPRARSSLIRLTPPAPYTAAFPRWSTAAATASSTLI
jgi:hypothetical protein